MAKPFPTVERVKELLDYDQLTGVFVWKVHRSWNATAGTIAGCQSTLGYWDICVDGVLCKSHRLAWVISYGEWPPHEIDHIDGDRMNNAIANLRCATTRQNQSNKGLQCNNASGFKGVSFHAGRQKWRAQIGVAGRRKWLGDFATIDEAAAAYSAAANQLHGEFARFQ